MKGRQNGSMRESRRHLKQTRKLKIETVGLALSLPGGELKLVFKGGNSSYQSLVEWRKPRVTSGGAHFIIKFKKNVKINHPGSKKKKPST